MNIEIGLRVTTEPRCAREVDVRLLSDDSRGQSKLDQLHFLALSVASDLVVRMRREKSATAIVYEIPQLLSRKQKNLMTVWPGKSSIRLRILQDEPAGTRGEIYDSDERCSYLQRLIGLYDRLKSEYYANFEVT